MDPVAIKQFAAKLPELKAKLEESKKGGSIMPALLPVFFVAMGSSWIPGLAGLFTTLSLWHHAHPAVFPAVLVGLTAFLFWREVPPLFDQPRLLVKLRQAA